VWPWAIALNDALCGLKRSGRCQQLTRSPHLREARFPPQSHLLETRNSPKYRLLDGHFSNSVGCIGSSVCAHIQQNGHYRNNCLGRPRHLVYGLCDLLWPSSCTQVANIRSVTRCETIKQLAIILTHLCRRTPIAWLHRLIWVHIPNGVLGFDQVVSKGRVTASCTRFFNYMMYDKHPTILVRYQPSV
jgi:hypothetical protein